MSCVNYKKAHNSTEPFIILSFGVYNDSDEKEDVDTSALNEESKDIFRKYIKVSFVDKLNGYGFYLTVHHIIFIDNGIDVIASYTENKKQFYEFHNLEDLIDILHQKSIWQVTFPNEQKTVNSGKNQYKFRSLHLTYCK
jgi:hypothetical protein